jgi:CubicO group peptidase (beta-lactamase class C family)
VTDHLPGFQMYDPWVTREMTIRDLLVHRSGLGLGAGDLLFVPDSNLSRAETVRRLRYIKPATSFRSGYAYDNILYMVAGQVIEAVTGQRWEDYVEEHVLKPAGMVNSTTHPARRFATADRARPHARIGGPVRGMGKLSVLDEKLSLGENSAPAGSGMAVSSHDMARWLLIQLAHGKLPEGNGRLFSAEASKEMWTPVVLIPNHPLPPPLEAEQPMFKTYALGWGVQDYKGARIVSHGGAVFGFQTNVVLIPDKNVGFYLTINSEDGEILLGLSYELLDHYLGAPDQHWPEKFIAFKKQKIEGGLKALHQATAKPAKVGPSLPLARYVGTYHDPWYGNIEVAQNKAGKLTIDFKSTPRMGGTLEHFQYDSFTTKFDDRNIEPAYVTFGLDADGKVERVTMKPVSPIADFSYDYQDLLFTPVQEAKKD